MGRAVHLTEAEKKKISELRKAGRSLNEIAKEIGRSKTAVYQEVERAKKPAKEETRGRKKKEQMKKPEASDSLELLMAEMSIIEEKETTEEEEEEGKTEKMEIESGIGSGTNAMFAQTENAADSPFFLDGYEGDGSEMSHLLFVAEQTEPLPWTQVPKSVLAANNLKKLGEGTYGEVFSTTHNRMKVVMKVVPFEKDPSSPIYDGLVNGSTMPSCSSIIPEVVVNKELTLLSGKSGNSSPNFIRLIEARVLRGRFPASLLKAWDVFAKYKGSENDRPSDYSSRDQTYIAIFTEHGGVDLENFEARNFEEIVSIIIQLLISLVVAEKELEFEHRDLHLGNVLISRTEEERLRYSLDGQKMEVAANGVKANIIDFTLSRIKKGKTTVYHNLERDPAIFEGEGDAQFDVYRKMREGNNKNWSSFQPSSNAMWVQFLVQKMTQPPICPEAAATKANKKKLQKFVARLQKFTSCSDILKDENFRAAFFKDYIIYK